MYTAYEISKLSDDELYRELKKRGLNQGPVISTTRSIYEKKLLKKIQENETRNLTIDDVSHLTNDELHKELKKRGIDRGPVSPTTRSVYEKLLIKNIKQGTIPQQKIKIDTYDEIPMEINNKETESLFPKLEFKLLHNKNNIKNEHLIERPMRSYQDDYKPEYLNVNQKKNNFGQNFNTYENQDQDSFLRSRNLNFPTRYDYSKFNSKYHDQYNDSYLGYAAQNIQPTVELPNSNQTKVNLFKLDPKVLLNNNVSNGAFNQNYPSTEYQKTGLYNKPAPEMPKFNSNRYAQANKSWNIFDLSKKVESWKIVLILILALTLILTMIFINNSENPIDE